LGFLIIRKELKKRGPDVMRSLIRSVSPGARNHGAKDEKFNYYT